MKTVSNIFSIFFDGILTVFLWIFLAFFIFDLVTGFAVLFAWGFFAIELPRKISFFIYNLLTRHISLYSWDVFMKIVCFIIFCVLFMLLTITFWYLLIGLLELIGFTWGDASLLIYDACPHPRVC